MARDIIDKTVSGILTKNLSYVSEAIRGGY
jgi:hypothetical protein